MARNHTIRDVAREAGVSVATVSRVLNNKPDASAEAREKVDQLIGTFLLFGPLTSSRKSDLTRSATPEPFRLPLPLGS